jgi:hypothetical protein
MLPSRVQHHAHQSTPCLSSTNTVDLHAEHSPASAAARLSESPRAPVGGTNCLPRCLRIAAVGRRPWQSHRLGWRKQQNSEGIYAHFSCSRLVKTSAEFPVFLCETLCTLWLKRTTIPAPFHHPSHCQRRRISAGHLSVSATKTRRGIPRALGFRPRRGGWNRRTLTPVCHSG